MAAIFGETKIFVTIGITILQIYPMGKKFRQNRSISHSFQDKSIFVFCNFCKKKFENSKWPPFLVRENFFENCVDYSAGIPCG